MRAKLIILLSLICLGIQAQTSILALSDYSNARMEGFGNVGVVAPVDYGFAAFKENPALLSHFSGQFGGVFSNDLSYGMGVGMIGFVVSPGKRHIVGGGVRTFGNYHIESLGDADNQKTSKKDFILNLVYAFKLSEKIRIGASINYLDYFVRRTIYHQG